MLAPPSFRSFLSPVVPNGCQGGRSGCGPAWNCSSRSEEITVWVRCRSAGLPIVTSRTVERCAEHSTTQSRRRARGTRCVPARRSTNVAVLDAWLVADEDDPRKQRHTARRVWQRLVAEHQARRSEVTVSRNVARSRIELGLLRRELTIPQSHLLGAEPEVHFGEFYATIAPSRASIESHLGWLGWVRRASPRAARTTRLSAWRASRRCGPCSYRTVIVWLSTIDIAKAVRPGPSRRRSSTGDFQLVPDAGTGGAAQDVFGAPPHSFGPRQPTVP